MGDRSYSNSRNQKNFRVLEHDVNTAFPKLKGLCQLESMRADVMQITFNGQNSIVFNASLSLSRSLKFTETFTSELGLYKGYFDRI